MASEQSSQKLPIKVEIHNHLGPKRSVKRIQKEEKKSKKEKPLKRKPVEEKVESDAVMEEAPAKKVKSEKAVKEYKPYSEQVLKTIEEIKQLEKEGKQNLSRDVLCERLDKKSAKVLFQKHADKAKLTREEKLFLVAVNSKRIELEMEPIADLFKKGRTIGGKNDVYHCKSKHTSGNLEVFDLKKNDNGKVVSIKASDKAKIQWAANEPRRIEQAIALLQSKGFSVVKGDLVLKEIGIEPETVGPSNSESDE